MSRNAPEEPSCARTAQVHSRSSEGTNDIHLSILHQAIAITTAAEVDANLSEPSRKTYKVRVVERSSGGGSRIVEAPSRKKQSRLLRPLEKLTRKTARRSIRFMQDYLYLHDRSNTKSKNGWIRNYVKNMRKASRRGND